MELETVAIRSWKNPDVMWRINKEDYDPDQHELWPDAPADTPQPAMDTPAPIAVDEAGPVDFDPVMPLSPSADEADSDFVTDSHGDIKDVVVVDPLDKRKQLKISAMAYDPDQHVLWSERNKK